MNKETAIAQLAAARKVWKNNGSTTQFNKVEGAIFNAFRLANPDWGTAWPEVQRAARQKQFDNV